MSNYKCGHAPKPVFVKNDEPIVFALYKVWKDRNKDEQCFPCFCEKAKAAKEMV